MSLDLFMKNIKINKISDTYYTVTATTKRFGKNQVMYEGISERDCKSYIKRTLEVRLPDRFNVHKVWIIKKDLQGHYFLGQVIKGIESQLHRVRKSVVVDLIEALRRDK